MKLIDKDALVAEIRKRLLPVIRDKHYDEWEEWQNSERISILDIIDTLEVIDPYEQCIQYSSIEDGIKAHAETYSFNIESELFNQLTKEQQELWRKEIEQAYISGGEVGVELAKDARYKENLEVKEVKEEPVSEELEKVAQEYATKEGYLAGLHYNSMVRAFKAGAKWHASHNTKLPDNLLLAARKASIAMCDYDDEYLDEYPYNPIEEQKFIEGAKWQKKQLKAKGEVEDRDTLKSKDELNNKQ